MAVRNEKSGIYVLKSGIYILKSGISISSPVRETEKIYAATSANIILRYFILILNLFPYIL